MGIILVYIYIYITETSVTPTIFQVTNIFFLFILDFISYIFIISLQHVIILLSVTIV